MKQSPRQIIARIVSLAFVALAVGYAAPAQAAAANSVRTIVVSGQGVISAQPDQARLTAGVVNQAATAGAALAANSTAMNRVFAALKEAGIAEAKIRTTNFSVQPQYPPSTADNPQPHTIIGYQVSNQVMVVVDNLAKLGATMDALVKSGANQVGNVAFSVADVNPLVQKARAAAVADAIDKAKTLAAAAGIVLGPVLTMQEGGVVRPVTPLAFGAAAVGVPVGAPPPPIAAGEQNVTVNVTMTYSIQ